MSEKKFAILFPSLCAPPPPQSRSILFPSPFVQFYTLPLLWLLHAAAAAALYGLRNKSPDYPVLSRSQIHCATRLGEKTNQQTFIQPVCLSRAIRNRIDQGAVRVCLWSRSSSAAAAAVVLGWQQRERGRPATSVGDYNIDVAPCVFYQCAAVITRRRCCRSSALCVRFYNNPRRNMSYMLDCLSHIIRQQLGTERP